MGPAPGCTRSTTILRASACGIGERLRIRVDRSGGDGGRVEPPQPVGSGLLGRGPLDLGDERLTVAHAIAPTSEADVGGQLGPVDRPAERLEELVVVGAHREPAVAGSQRLVRRGQAVRGAERLRRPAGHPVLGRLPHGQRQRGFQQRGVDQLALAGALAVLERAQHTVGAEQAGRQVADGEPGLGRRALLVAGHADDAAHALRDQIVTAAACVGPGAAEPRDGAVDQPGVDRAQRVVVDAESGGGAGPVILHENVGRLHQPVDDLHAGRLLEIHGDPALAAVDRREGAAVAVLAGRAAPHVLAGGRLHLDDVGPHVGQVHRTERGGHGLREVDHPEAGQRLHAR